MKKVRPQPLQIYQMLPRTNCKLCDCPSCMAFAFALITKEHSLDDCPDLNSEAFSNQLEKLRELLGSGKPIEGTGFVFDEKACIGCGDCIAACNQGLTTVVQNTPFGVTTLQRDPVPPVLQIIDGRLNVINWDSCKRTGTGVTDCRTCESKCPFSAIELVSTQPKDKDKDSEL